jgi:hypothetical protein
MNFFVKTLVKVFFIFTSSLASGFDQDGLESSKNQTKLLFNSLVLTDQKTKIIARLNQKYELINN